MDGDQMTKPAAGMSADALAQIAPSLQAVVDAGDLSGFVTLIWRKGEVVQLNTLGHRDVAGGKPMTRDTMFRIASMTKPITSVAALMLMEEGKLKLDDPITKWAPEFANMKVLKSPTGPLDEVYDSPRDITIDDLMTHRSGLAYGFTSIGPIAHAYEAALGSPLVNPLEPDEWMARLAELPLSFAPGDRFHYSHATDLLGFLIGRIEGKPFYDVLQERIFGPLGMVDTGFFAPPEKAHRLARLYRSSTTKDGLVAVDRPPMLGDNLSPPDVPSGGGGLVSTLDDYARFAQMLLNKGELGGVRVISAEAVALMTSNHLSDALINGGFGVGAMAIRPGFGYGFNGAVFTDPEKAGLPVGRGTYEWDGAAGTWFWVDWENDLIFVGMIQRFEVSGKMTNAQQLTQKLLAPAIVKDA